ncbi:MAG: hypothetical protein QOG69_1432 [Actinomycetota bacterium]|nr:hypothetical protein [Actinomycetota bacterium]
MSADQFCPCGLGAASTAPRCRACPAPGHATWAGQQAPEPIGVPAGSVTGVAAFDPRYDGQRTTNPDAGTLKTYSRWKKSEGTFGPTGRIVATLLLLLPLTLAAAAIATGIGMVGGGIYIFVIMPWALRDIWKKAATVIEPPRPAGVPPRF